MPLRENFGDLQPDVIIRFYRREGDAHPYHVTACEGGPEAAAALRKFDGRLPSGEFVEIEVKPNSAGQGAERARATDAELERIAAAVEGRPGRRPRGGGPPDGGGAPAGGGGRP